MSPFEGSLHPDPGPPEGLAEDVLKAARRARHTRRGRRFRLLSLRFALAAVLLAAAAGVGGVLRARPGRRALTAVEGLAAGGLSPESVQELLRSLAASPSGAGPLSPLAHEAGRGEGAGSARALPPEEAADPTSCARALAATSDFPSGPVRAEAILFQGRPAWLVVLRAEDPGRGRLEAWVVAAGHCPDVLYFAQVPLAP